MLGAGAASAQPTVRVLIESPVKATLERDGDGPVCNSPCDVDVPVDGTYRMRVAGERETSPPFELRALPGWSRLTLKFETVKQSADSAAHGVRTAWREPEPTNRAEPAPLVVPSLRFSF